MKKQAIVHNIKGIQCDAKNCDYEDLHAEFEPEKHLNKPCPKCGANLFTQEAYEQMQRMQKLFSMINKVVAESDIDIENEEYVNIELKHNEQGLINGFEVIEDEKGVK